MSDETPDDIAEQAEGDDTEAAMDVESSAGGQAVKAGGLSIAPVRMTSEVGEDGQKKVPGIKIIGLSSELKKAMTGEESKDGSVEDDDEEEAEDEEESEEEEDEDEEEDDEEEAEEPGEDEESSLDASEVKMKTPKVTIRKVMQVTTPGTAGGKDDSTPKKMPFAGSASVTSTVKKRGRPSRADLALREQERQEALARGEPDPELKRKRRKPLKLNDADSEEDSREERKKRKREEREERRQKKPKPRSEDTEDTDVEEKPKKKGRKKKILTPEEEKARDEERKRKYKEIRDRQKAKLERRKAYLIRKREERKEKKAEEKKKHEEHLQRMAELRSQYLDDNASDLPEGLMDENSQNSNPMFAKTKKKWGDVSQTELSSGVYNPLAHVTSETLFEYKWPLEGRHSEHYFLQEQVTEFLGVKSFKRKYPDCPRRTINMEERDFLIEMKIVNETQADLGLTAIPSAYVLDIMCADFYDKYEEYLAVINERKERSSRNYNYSSGSGNIKIEEAVKAAAEFNKKFNEERKSQRGAYFDIQTFTCQYPKDNKGIMKVLKKPSPGNYPVAMIPGQFVDHYRPYSSRELRLFPLNTLTSAPPAKGLTTRDLNLGSEDSESDSGSSSSDSSSDSDSESESEAEQKKSLKSDKPKPPQPFKVELKPRKKVDEIKPFATCKHCSGNMNQNKIGVPEMLLHCSKCDQSSHPTCVGLSLELIHFVTSYEWECTDCKKCMSCNKSEDEDKMLFCDLCDRGFHIYCVGLDEIPGGRWHCGSCASCESCGTKCPAGEDDEDESLEWIFETKIDSKGNKVYSHTMCHPCHKQWKKGNFCPECNGVFGRSKYKVLASCWVCSRQHHAKCVGLEKSTDRFICAACQKRTQEKTIAGGRKEEKPSTATPGNSFSRTPVTASYSRSGRRVTQINFANQF